VLVNVHVADKRPIDELPSFVKLQRQVEVELGSRGRILIRYSGTESKARVMVEGEDEARVHELANDLAEHLERALAKEE
jgi:phosphoglucosamine mutase